MASVRSFRVAGAAVLFSATFAAACSLWTDLDGLGSTTDASTTDALAEAAPAGGFTIGVTPSHITADPGDVATTVVVTVTRGVGFTERVQFAVSGGIPNAATTPSDVDVNATTTTMTVLAPNGAVVDYLEHKFVVRGTSVSGPQTATADLFLRVGSLLVPGDGGVISVPGFAYAIDVKAWGAGGGGGPYRMYADGGNGGPGGFAFARFAVTPNSTLYAIAGTGGPGSGYGGGGGGFSGLRDGANTYWLIAGGGGGGATAATGTGLGGAGGGATGAGAGGGCGPGGGATQTGGGAGGTCSSGTAATDGASLSGGDAVTPAGLGGVPGGGRGSGSVGSYQATGGGGGGGYFGGGGGGAYGFSVSAGGGGGGGSSHVRDGGADAMLARSDAAAPPATTDPDYAPGVGVGGTGGDHNALVPAKSGGDGRVVVRLAKP